MTDPPPPGTTHRAYLPGDGGVVEWSAQHVAVERWRLALTVNYLKSRRWDTAKELASWRSWAREVATTYRLPTLTPPVVVTVEHWRPNRAHMPDPGATVFAQKGALDGLVQAGVLLSDDGAAVRRVIFEAPEVRGIHAVRITLQEVAHG